LSSELPGHPWQLSLTISPWVGAMTNDNGQKRNGGLRDAFYPLTRTASIHDSRAALTYSAKRYDSAICCSKMSCDAFLSKVLYEANKALEKFDAAPRECACLQNGGRSRQ